MDLASTLDAASPAPSRGGATDRRREPNTPSAAVGLSVLIHAAALAALLMREVAPYSPPRLDVVEVTLVPAQVPDGARAAIHGDRAVDVSTSSFLSLTHPNVAAMTSSSNWPGSIKAGRAFDPPVPGAFRLRGPALAFDALATMLDCFALGATRRDVSGHERRAHSPCASDDPLLRAHATMLSPTYAWVAGEVGADNDYRTFKTVQPVFDESLFPDKVPEANRALKRSFFGWFR